MFSGCNVPAILRLFSTIFPKIMVEVMTLGQPLVRKPWLWASKGMLPVKHLAPKILKIMAVNYCGCKLARRMWWVAHAYHKKECAAPHPWGCKFGLQYDGRLDWRIGVRVEMWNLGSTGWKGGRSL